MTSSASVDPSAANRDNAGASFPLEYSPQGRAERLIAGSRLLLAVAGLFVVWLDPTEPTRYAGLTYVLLAVYVLYATVVAWLVWRSRMLLPRGPLAIHVLDIGAVCIVMYLTSGPNSPFFMYFVFTGIAATLRWSWRGALWTGGATLALFVAMGFLGSEVMHDPGFPLNQFLIRGTYLTVIVGMLAYMGYHARRGRNELAKLAGWPSEMDGESGVVDRALERVADVLRVPRVVMLWEDVDEPWVHVARWTDGVIERTRNPSGLRADVVAPALADSSFLCIDAHLDNPVVVRTSASGFQRWLGQPLHRNFQAEFAMHAVVSARLRGEGWEGRIFGLDRPTMTTDDVVLAEILALDITSRLDSAGRVERFKEATATEQRLRVARDLHDGVLQTLTGTALRLVVARTEIETAPEEARTRLADVQHDLAEVQGDLRSFIQELRPPGAPRSGIGIRRRLRELTARVQRDWGLRVVLHTDDELDLPEPVGQQIHYMVLEALINVSRHADATDAAVRIGADGANVRVIVSDNGRGFPFRGHYPLATLDRLNIGPRTLKERVAALGGTLVIDSADTGSRLAITVPLRG